MDLSQIPTEDLRALKSGDLSKVSTETIRYLKSQGNGKNIPFPPPNEPGLEDMGPMGILSIPEMAKSLPQGGAMGMMGAPAAVLKQAPSNYQQLAGLMLAGSSMAGDMAQGLKSIASPIAEGGANVIADVVGALAGKDPESLKVLFNNPKALFQKGAEIFGRMDQQKVISSIEQDFAAHGEKIGAIEDGISGNFGTPSYKKASEVVTRPSFDKVKFQMAKEGFRMPEEIAEGIPSVKVGKIAQDAPEYKFLVDQMKTLKENPRMAFGDALRMKRNIDRAVDYGLEGSSGMQPISEDASRLLKTMRQQINTDMKATLKPEDRELWTKANDEYAKASTARAELKRQVLGTTPRMTERRFHTFLKEGRYDDEVMSRAKDLGAKSIATLDDVRDKVAARQFKLWAEGSSASHFLPSSPKLMGYGASAAGGARQGIGTVINQVMNHPKVSAALLNAALQRDKKKEGQ